MIFKVRQTPPPKSSWGCGKGGQEIGWVCACPGHGGGGDVMSKPPESGTGQSGSKVCRELTHCRPGMAVTNLLHLVALKITCANDCTHLANFPAFRQWLEH